MSKNGRYSLPETPEQRRARQFAMLSELSELACDAARTAARRGHQAAVAGNNGALSAAIMAVELATDVVVCAMRAGRRVAADELKPRPAAVEPDVRQPDADAFARMQAAGKRHRYH